MHSGQGGQLSEVLKLTFFAGKFIRYGAIRSQNIERLDQLETSKTGGQRGRVGE